jgi:hypothetical protein
VIGVALVVFVLAGCAVQLRTAPAPANGCDLALVEGRLVADARSGLALAADETGASIEIIWPFGYSARRDPVELALIDERGAVVAREGDRINVGGGSGADDAFVACAGSVRVLQPGG